MTNVFLANFERGSEVVDLYQYMTKCLSLLNAEKRDHMCKRFCWSARGIDYISTAPLFQDIDIDCDIDNVIESTKNIIDEYYGINAKTLILKRKNDNKYHIYYTNVFVDKLMLKFINLQVNKRMNANSVDNCCAFPRLEGFNKWKWKESPWDHTSSGSVTIQQDENGHFIIPKEEGYYEQDSYYLPLDSSITWKQIYELIYKFNCDKSVLIKPVDQNELKMLMPYFVGGECVNYVDMDITDEQHEIIDQYETIGSVKSADNCYMFDVMTVCPFNDHNGTNHRYFVISKNKIILKCHSERCNGKYKILYQKSSCLFEDIENDHHSFNIKTFDKITNNTSQQMDIRLNEYTIKCDKLNQKISDLQSSLLDIDTDLKTNIIQKQRQTINKNIRHNQNEITKIQAQMKQLTKDKSQLLLEVKSKYFELFHAKIMKPLTYLNHSYGDIHLYNKQSLFDAYENLLLSNNNSFISKWLKRSNIRTYDKLDFLPPPASVPSHIYNTFNGFTVENDSKSYESHTTESDDTSENDTNENDTVESDTNIDYDKIKPILRHLVILTNHHAQSYEYVLNYLAHLMQKPGELPGVALVFHSNKEGVGKNLMFEEFIGYSLLGSKYVLQTTDIDKIFGRFSMVNNKLLVILDETKGKDTFLNNEKIKNFITTNKIAWERKGVDGFTINNFARLLFFTNNDTPVSIPYGDRRFACFDCSNEFANNRQYFKYLIPILKDDSVIHEFYMFLKSRDISRFDIVSDRPETEFYRELRQHSIPCIARFLIHCISNNSSDNHLAGDRSTNNITQIYARDLYDNFKNWCQDTNRNVSYTDTRFGKELKKYDGVTKKRTNRGQKYILDFDTIEQDMIQKQYLSKDECLIEYDSE